jgi:hypothetical protein
MVLDLDMERAMYGGRSHASSDGKGEGVGRRIRFIY